MVLCRGVALLFPAATIAAPIPGAALCRNRQAESMALISSRSNYVRCYIAALRRVVHAVLSTDIVSDPSKHCTGGEVLPGNSREGGGRQRRIASGRCRGFSQNSELVRPRAWCWVTHGHFVDDQREVSLLSSWLRARRDTQHVDQNRLPAGTQLAKRVGEAAANPITLH